MGLAAGEAVSVVRCVAPRVCGKLGIAATHLPIALLRNEFVDVEPESFERWAMPPEITVYTNVSLVR